jgi:hypothetical protein
MPFNVTELELIELSLVDEPANPAARVVMFKRYDTMNDDDKMKELIASGMSEDDARKEVARMKRNKGAGPSGDQGKGAGVADGYSAHSDGFGGGAHNDVSSIFTVTDRVSLPPPLKIVPDVGVASR